VNMLPGTMFLIDTSAAARMEANDQIHELIANLIDRGLAATCITLDLEAGFSARPQDVIPLHAFRTEFMIELPVTAAVTGRAREIQGLMAKRGLHRAAGSMDLLTAAVAEIHRAIILHYDADFEHIASITGQRHEWIAPRGSID
jgi:predicted nucleic acid-binding protein